MPKVTHHRFGSVTYELDIYEPHHGSCDLEKPRHPKIIVNEDLNTKQGMQTLIHELNHAILENCHGKKKSWNMSHDFIDWMSVHLGEAMWAIGYRRRKQ